MGSVIMTIDPGMKMGYAIGVGGSDKTLLKFGTIYSKSYDEAVNKLIELITTFKPNKLIIEDFRVYNFKLKDAHKTPTIIGIAIGIFKSLLPDGVYTLIQHKAWKTRASKLKPFNEEWQKALEGGSEHSRDAVAMLLSYI